MIRYIKLKNYRSFTDLDFNLMSKNGIPQKFALVYGENGSGKSNITSVFDFLAFTFHTMNTGKSIMRYLEEHPDINNSKQLAGLDFFTDITRIIRQNKTVASTDNMVIEIGFYLAGKNGSYLLEFDNDQIVHERLEYTLSKNRGVYFDVTKKEVKINLSVFSDFKKDLSEMIMKFWGKHSVISLINNAREEYASDYFESNVSSSLLHLLDYLDSIYIYLTDSHQKSGIINIDNSLPLNRYTSGEIPASEISRLETTERKLNKYFKSMYRDIRNVFYKKDIIDDKINYELYFTRYISGKERTVHYSKESCGTKKLILLLPYCLAATEGHTVVIDEIDNGIHDVLLRNMLKSLYKDITGQVIITTHNTLLLNEYDFKDSFYFIEVDEEGSHRINVPSDFGYRIQPDSNVVFNYLQGKFKGIPWTDMNINFHDISSND